MMTKRIALFAFTALLLPIDVLAQPDVPVEEWTGKTVLFIGAHPDDDSRSHGTLAMLQANGNDVHILLMTLGNVGTKDPDLSRIELAKIRRQEELAALAKLGIPEKNYINLGYDDGRLEYADREEAIRRLVYHIRRLRPNVLFAFDPGQEEQRWHKADHRTAAYLAADAARAAEWPLLYTGQIVNDGLEAYQIEEYVFFDTNDANMWVDIADYVDEKIEAAAQYVSQWGPEGQYKYYPVLTAEQQEAARERMQRRIEMRDGTPVETFRYHQGVPDAIGR